MIDPYDFVAPSTVTKSKQIVSKSIIKKSSKKRNFNDMPRRVSIRKATSKFHIDKHSIITDTSHINDAHEKENSLNNGFTQFIQTKMMEANRRQKKNSNKTVQLTANNNDIPLVNKKRFRSEIENNSDTAHPATIVIKTTDEHVNGGARKIANLPPTNEQKECYLIQPNKRRRACLCSKRQLDELEFTCNTVVTQIQQPQIEEEQRREVSHIEPVLNCSQHSPLPPLPSLLLPLSPNAVPQATSTGLVPTISVNEHREEEQEQEQENQLHVSSILAAPLSPAMPLNSTYIAHRSIPLLTQIPSTLLSLSTMRPHNITTSNNVTSIVPNSIVDPTTVEHDNTSEHAPLTVSITSRQDQSTSMTQTKQNCSVSTQTNDDCYLVHQPCNDVSLCPCVQIYTRSEQLFMTSMSIFLRNTMAVTPPEPPVIKQTKKAKANIDKEPVKLITPQSTPVIHNIEKPIPVQTNTHKSDNIRLNETYIIPAKESEPEPLLKVINTDGSTMIDETNNDNSKKSDGSSIQIKVNGKDELNHEKIQEEKFTLKFSNDQHKFKSLVLAMTALKDHQKIVFNHFVECFSVRTSTSVDETTTHLITDEDNENSLKCPLTGKVLQGVARHLSIVSCRWLKACLDERRYVDEIPTYEIIGDTVYNEHYGMSRSRLSRSNNCRLLENYAFHLKCHGCQPFIDNRPLIELINLSGGLVLKTLNQHIDNIGRQIIILCSKTYLENKHALQQACQKLNIICVEPEWLIACIVKYDLLPYEPWRCILYS